MGFVLFEMSQFPYQARLFIWKRKVKELNRIIPSQSQSLFRRHVGKHSVQELHGFWPSGLRVRKVIAPEHSVHADPVPQQNADLIFLKDGKHITAPIVAGQKILCGFVVGIDRAVGIGEVHLLQPVRSPRYLVLDRPDLEVWICLVSYMDILESGRICFVTF